MIFFIWNHLSKKKSREFPHIWNLNFETTSYGEMTVTKFVDLEKLLNFVVDNFFFSIYYGPKYSF